MTRLPSGKELVILELLSERKELYGLELVHLSGGALKRGTVYVTLGRMEKRGLVASRQDDVVVGSIGLPKRLYWVTALGMRSLHAVRAAHGVLGAAPAQ